MGRPGLHLGSVAAGHLCPIGHGGRLRERECGAELTTSSALWVGIVLLAAPPALGLARLVVMYGWFEAQGMSFRAATQAVNALYDSEPGKFRVSGSLFVLFDDLQRLEVQRPVCRLS
jgi:hypothetical protein